MRHGVKGVYIYTLNNDQLTQEVTDDPCGPRKDAFDGVTLNRMPENGETYSRALLRVEPRPKPPEDVSSVPSSGGPAGRQYWWPLSRYSRGSRTPEQRRHPPREEHQARPPAT